MNSKAERFVVRPGVVLLAFLISIPLHAQDSGAVLSGTVTDASGKAVPGARITIKNVATGQATETRTDSAGSYDALNLTPGAYEAREARPRPGGRKGRLTDAK
ncbi:MAG: carboxypeptidase-like regulatory domain-containing protein [Acidobacteriota bacterium]|nr:carboxypeptidase-like regulatory domain-containing protein [Acidobacteriota bacterium]